MVGVIAHLNPALLIVWQGIQLHLAAIDGDRHRSCLREELAGALEREGKHVEELHVQVAILKDICGNHARLQGLRMQVEEGAFFPEQPFQFPFIPPRWRTSYLFHQHKHNGRYAECQYPPNNFLCFWCRFIVFDGDCRPIVRKKIEQIE
jgi:hypothetical protein